MGGGVYCGYILRMGICKGDIIARGSLDQVYCGWRILHDLNVVGDVRCMYERGWWICTGNWWYSLWHGRDCGTSDSSWGTSRLLGLKENGQGVSLVMKNEVVVEASLRPDVPAPWYVILYLSTIPFLSSSVRYNYRSEFHLFLLNPLGCQLLPEHFRPGYL